jgi:hypothetical protein
MSYLTKKELNTVILPSDSSYWVKINSDFTYADVKAVQDSPESAKATDITLQLAIKEWNLDDDEGKVLDITPENIDALRKEDFYAIVVALEKEAGDNSEKKDSSK